MNERSLLLNNTSAEVKPDDDESSSNLEQDEVPSSVQGYLSRRGRLNSSASSFAGSVRLVVDNAFSMPGKSASIRDFSGQATVASEIATISKNLIGGGVLSLSGGIAICANAPRAIGPAAMWILFLGFVFGYYCWLIGKLCKLTGQVTYRELWQSTVGDRGRLAVPLVNALKAGLGNLGYSAILSQTGVSLCAALGFNVSRIASLFAVTIVMVLPLCLLKNLHVLSPFSVLGTAGILVTVIAMTVRYLDGSYQPGGQFYSHLEPAFVPSFGVINGAWSLHVLPFVCMCFEAYVMHYNSARLYAELKNTSLSRFGGVVGGSFGFTAAVYIAIASIGFLTFGSNSSGYILNNYSSLDPLATLCRVMVAFSTLTSYPIVFMGFRDGMLELLDIAMDRHTEPNLNLLSVILLLTLTILAIFVTDLGLINAVGGGTLATAMVFFFPTFMYHSLVRERNLTEEKKQVLVTTLFAIAGIALGICGVYLSLTR
ncbi:hypothetical protein ACA910_003746 [Epithemia clementina (nom. ined.)]